VLVGERLQLPLVDGTALRGLLDEALGRRQIMQVNRLVQLSPFLGRMGRFEAAAPGWSARGLRRDEPSAFTDL